MADLQPLLVNYEVQSFIARGAMGAVYRAYQPSLGRMVAIKILPAVLNSEDGQYGRRFIHEAQVMGSLSHPGIVSVHEAGALKEGTLYYVMEYVQGSDLGKALEAQGRLEPERVLNLGMKICEALHLAHQRGIIHCDIKPANLMLTESGQVKIADFGLARTLESDELALTQIGRVMGTPFFTAPELVGSAEPGVRSDIYALGITLYQMLTGHIPQGAFQPPSKLVDRLDPRWDAIIQQALQTDPGERQMDAEVLRQQLQTLTQPAPHRRWLGWLGSSLIALSTLGWWQLTDWAPHSQAPADTVPRVTNLLPRFDLKKGTPEDCWRHTSSGFLTAEKRGTPCVLSVHFPVVEEYDYEIEFTAHQDTRETFVNQVFEVGGQPVEWSLSISSLSRSPYHSFLWLDGKDPLETPEVRTALPAHLNRAQRYHSLIQVRKGGLKAWLDGQLLVDWRGDPRRFGRSKFIEWPSGHIGFLTWNGGVTFHKMQITEHLPLGSKMHFPAVKADQAAAPEATLTPPKKEPRAEPEIAPSSPLPLGLLSASREQPYVNTLGMKFLPLPGTQSLIGIHEVRHQDYAAYAAANQGIDLAWEKADREGFPVGYENDHPVVFTNWNDAKDFCRWLSAKEGLAYRLPTDREWSIAAGIAEREKADLTPETKGKYNLNLYAWGTDWPPPAGYGNFNDISHYQAFGIVPRPSFNDGYATTSPVMSFKPNALGIYDLSGNVWEWCEDWLNTAEQERVLRGGHFGDIKSKYYPLSCRTSRRPESRFLCDGFRCVIAQSKTADTAPEAAAFELDVRLEDDAQADITLLWTSLGQDIPIGTFRPGRQRVPIQGRKDGPNYLKIRSSGYAMQQHTLALSGGQLQAPLSPVCLYRCRYVIMRVTHASSGRRQFTEPGLRHTRVALTDYAAPENIGSFDWDIHLGTEAGFQKGLWGTIPWLRLHHPSQDSGFAAAREGETFETMSEAPALGYGHTNPRATPGLKLYYQNYGNGTTDKGYGKLEIEAVTEIPPADALIVMPRIR